MNPYLVLILAALVGEYVLRTITRYLNVKSLCPDLPSEFHGFYDAEKYRQSQKYTRAHASFAYFSSTFELIVMLAFILLGGFNVVDQIVRGFALPPILTGLAFFGILFLLQDLLSTPLTLYETFVIEERFGFNRMTFRTFLADKLKSYLLLLILGSALIGGILYFFDAMGQYAWLYAWGLVSLFILIAPRLFNTFIAPLFNKFSPLPEGELRAAIETYAERLRFPLSDISVMDGSRRSTHSNAYFSGLGKRKRIALYDTLIEQHTVPELVAVLAHEIAHYTQKHVLKGTVMSILHTGVLFLLLSLFLQTPLLFQAFGMDQLSTYAGIVFFAILYTPVELVLSVAMNVLSRKHEYEADAVAAKHLGTTEPLITGLKKLSVANLGNLTPHSLTVWLNYSHPPILQRIARLRC